MNRRDFLFFRTEGEESIAELSCEKLYMHFSDIDSAGKFGQNESGLAEDAEWWSGEPSIVVNSMNAETLFASLAKEISAADVLVISDRQWLVEGRFSEFIEVLLKQFASTGKTVKYKEQGASE